MAIESVIKQTQADSVYTHFGEDTHPDHRHIARAAAPAARSVRNPLFFEGLSFQYFDPSVFVDTGDVIHQNLGALEAHASQISRTNIEQMNIVDIAQSAAHFRGIQGRVTHAEGFVPVRYFM